MAYTIYNNDGTILLTLADAQVDSVTTSLDLIGKNVNNYGQYVNNNLVKLLTSFASATDEPANPQVGQLWFNTTTGRLSVYNGVEFTPTYGSHVDGTEPATISTGDFWYDTINSQLKLWNGSTYKLIGPAVSGIYGKFGIETPTTPILTDDTNIPQKISVINSYGNSVGFITTSGFTMSAAASLTYLGASQATSVVSGLTLFQNLHVRGNVTIDGVISGRPNTSLTASYDITYYGDTEDSGATTATRVSRLLDGNNAIRVDLLKLFPVATRNSIYDTVGQDYGAEVRVM